MDNTNNTGTNARASIDLVNIWQEKSRQIDSPPVLLPRQEHRLFKRFASLYRILASQPRKLRRRLARKAGLGLTDIAFMLAVGLSLPAEAQTILVNTNAPGINRDGLCSLIEAINNANGDKKTHADCPAGSGADTIVLQNNSTHTITGSVNAKPGQGLPAIFSEMTIEGNNSTINVSAVPVDVVFNVAPKGNLTLKDATITGDTGSGTGTDAPRLHNTGMVQLSNVTVLLNPDRVSAITNAGLGSMSADGLDVNCIGDCAQYQYPPNFTGHGILNRGTLTLVNSQVRNLMLPQSFNYYPGDNVGAVYNSGTMNLNSVLVENNSSPYGGNSGIDNRGVVTGKHVTVTHNSASFGTCGISNRPEASLTLEDSSVSEAGYTYYGCDLLSNYGTAHLDRVVIEGCRNRGEMVLTDSSVRGFNSNGDLSLDGVTITDSVGVSIAGTAAINNSTITGNTNFGGGNHPFALSSAINFSGDITINNSTIGGSDLGDYGYLNATQFSGILFDGNISLTNSVIAGSYKWPGDTTTIPFFNAFINNGTLNTDNNLIGDSGFTNAEAFIGFTPSPTDITATSDGTNPTPLAGILDTVALSTGQLIPRLADNGGPTLTVALVDGSPAIDAADNTSCPSTDQRGVSRPQGAGCDIGAYEFDGGPPAAPPVTEAGEISANHNWTTVSPADMPGSPVVIAGPPTFNGGDPGVVRLRNVGSSGFEIRFQEWDYRDGKHTDEQIPYLVVRTGRHAMPDGSIWEAGTFSHSGTPNWKTRQFTESFPGTPHLLLTIQTINGGSAATARARQVTDTGFDIGFFEQESLMDGHASETVGYLAIFSSGSGSIEIDGVGVPYYIRQTTANHNWTEVPAGKQLKVEEEQSKDTETWHAFEAIDVMALEDSLFGQIVSSNGGDPASLRQRNSD